MKVVWTPEAFQDREEIWRFVAADDPAAAARLDALFSAATGRLKDFPASGRPGMIVGTREVKPHRNYRLVYEVGADAIWILALVHAAREWPPVGSSDRP